MSPLPGSSTYGLLHEAHATGCDGTEYSTGRPVPVPGGFAVVYMEWCGDCGACDWELVDAVEVDAR
jgi:hypothetical protein